MVTGNLFFIGDSAIDMIHRIFRVLGTPTLEEWPELATSKVKYISTVYEKRPLKQYFPDLNLEPHGFDLLQKMLYLNPKHRISAKIALMHVDFTQIALFC
jgi:serine/threonine protein kinase